MAALQLSCKRKLLFTTCRQPLVLDGGTNVLFVMVDESAGTCEPCATARAVKLLLRGVKLDGGALV